MSRVKYPGIDAVKSERRVRFVDEVVEVLTAPRFCKGLSKSISESGFILKIYEPLLDGLEKIYRENYPERQESWYDRAAEEALISEINTGTTLNNMQLFGLQHRPDMEIVQNNYRIALEFKVVSAGGNVRDALGQSLVYASRCDFVICVLLDVTDDGCVRDAFLHGEKERCLIDELWEEFSIRVVVVKPDMK